MSEYGDFIEELEGEIHSAYERFQESKKYGVNSYGHGQDCGELITLKRIKYRLENGEWPDF